MFVEKTPPVREHGTTWPEPLAIIQRQVREIALFTRSSRVGGRRTSHRACAAGGATRSRLGLRRDWGGRRWRYVHISDRRDHVASSKVVRHHAAVTCASRNRSVRHPCGEGIRSLASSVARTLRLGALREEAEQLRLALKSDVRAIQLLGDHVQRHAELNNRFQPLSLVRSQ